MTYYNTTYITGPLLEEAEQAARTQEDRVMAYFEFVGSSTPSEAWTHVFRCSVPITSVRRAISDLTDEGVLIKTTKLREGAFGKPEHEWRIARPEDRQQNLF